MKKKRNDNIMERKPAVKCGLKWKTDENGIVTLEIENRGVLKRLLKRPKVSFIRLDELGSFVWRQIDGKKDVYEIGQRIESHFGEKSAPVFNRLIKYFEILKSYKFIDWIA